MMSHISHRLSSGDMFKSGEPVEMPHQCSSERQHFQVDVFVSVVIVQVKEAIYTMKSRRSSGFSPLLSVFRQRYVFRSLTEGIGNKHAKE